MPGLLHRRHVLATKEVLYRDWNSRMAWRCGSRFSYGVTGLLSLVSPGVSLEENVAS